ncbi:MAG TPA: beta-ketoacyl synthase N-terminal-like domain-containing protein, partial [Candidatus Deferrimicrobium sp.]|nr:beta-ketoacyl synthase N-terminal-like domain-containing protein [Candidatus Deferrimicrobium sp.]
MQPSPGKNEIQNWLITQIAGYLALEPSSIDINAPFTSYGLASRDAVILSGDLENWLNCRLSPTLLYEYPNIESLSQYLIQGIGVADNMNNGEGPQNTENMAGDAGWIAITGIGCRFPGADGPGAFWQLLRDGVDAITQVPPDRWDADFYYSSNPELPGKMNTRWGGFLKQVDQFDAHFFGISPREAIRMDPQ